MSPEEVNAELTVERICNGETPEETIELCNAVIREAERIKEIAESELDNDDEFDEDED